MDSIAHGDMFVLSAENNNQPIDLTEFAEIGKTKRGGRSRSGMTLPDDVQAFRVEVEAFALSKADGWARDYLVASYHAWDAFNDGFLGGKLIPPVIRIGECAHGLTYGQYWPIGSGGTTEIVIRNTVATGAHPDFNASDRNGMTRFLIDVVRHETIHQAQHEIWQADESSWDGHGPVFRDICNVVGVRWGLPSVRSSKCGKKQKDVPSSAQWPFNVRPDGFYGSAYPVARLADKKYWFTHDIKSAMTALTSCFAHEEIAEIAVRIAQVYNTNAEASGHAERIELVRNAENTHIPKDILTEQEKMKERNVA